MANTKTIFLGTEQSRSNSTELHCYLNFSNEIFIMIEPEDQEPCFICLDRATAIRLCKILKSEIGKMEVENG